MENNSGEQFGAMIKQGHAVVRIENDVQQQISIARPRDEEKVYTGLVSELEGVPAFAKKAFYSIPYKDGKGGTTNVEGPSIGAAMAIARRWGNCATANRVLEEKEDRIICEGVFMDYETNNRVCRQVAVLRHYKPHDSNTMVPLRADRLALAIAAGLSKAVRNAVLHGVPESIKIRYIDEAKRIATQGTKKQPAKTLQDRVKDLLAGFEAQGVKTEQIRAYIGKDDIGEAEYSKLLGTLNALEDGLTTKAEVFGDPAAAQAVPKTLKNKPVDMKDLI